MEELREAGVVDAGGLGVAVVLDGLRAHLNSEEVKEPEETDLQPDLQAVHTGEDWGYCTQFVVTGFTGDDGEFEEHIHTIGRNVLVISDKDLARVHVHTQNPGEPLSYVTNFGRLSDINIEDMEAQVESCSTTEATHEQPTGDLGVVAVSQGEGNRRLFQSMGAVVVEGGQGENPRARELADAAQRTGARRVILLPNNKNVVPAAEQVGGLIDVPVYVIPPRNLAGRLSAMVSFDPEGDLETVAGKMRQIVENLLHAEVARSVRDTTVGYQRVPEGSYLGFLSGELAAVEKSVGAAAAKLAEKVAEEGVEILTLLRGEDLGEKDAARIVVRIAGPRRYSRSETAKRWAARLPAADGSRVEIVRAGVR